ncbi:anti-sigma factor family protein [Pseudonocardia sp. CA-142604]|uniref:anti-sigma factor family protein n=1 Tax=Pseudonocardia sp. CA-142604 TaxID=3240024 RepID=UPI003D8B8FD3
MNAARDHADIDSYVADELGPEEKKVVEDHLGTCSECREEVDVLRELQQLLADVPPEVLLDGPPEDADLLLQRTLRQVRAESSQVEGRRRYLAAAAAAAVAAVALVGGVLVGRVTLSENGQSIAAGPAPGSTTAAPATPGTRYASATDPSTGARVTAAIVPAAGWVRVSAAVTGIPAGQRCQLVVVAKDGTRETAGGWLVSEQGSTGGTTLDGSALIAPEDVAGVVVQNTGGKQFVEAKV